MRALISLIAVSVIALVACSTQIPSSRQLGVINIKDTTDGAGGYKIHPTAVFWEARNVNLPNSTVTPDTCLDTLYYPPDTTSAVIANQLDAGSPVLEQTPLGTGPVGQMTPDTVPNVLITYRNHTGGFAHAPGNDVLFTVPGAAGGFATSTIKKSCVRASPSAFFPSTSRILIAKPRRSGSRSCWKRAAPFEKRTYA